MPVTQLPFDGRDATFVLLFPEVEPGVVGTVPLRGGVPATFTRATAASTRLSKGNWKLDVAAGKPRFHYSRDGAPLGYLPEGARTQLLTGTDVRDMTTPNWIATNCTVTKNAVGIDGVANAASTLTATGANATVLLTFTAAASSRTYGAFIRRVTGTGNIDLTQDGASFTTVTVDDRFPETQQQLNASQLNAVIGIRIVNSGDSIVVDFNQFEAGTFSSTPIPIATVTRNADVLTYPLTGWYNAAAGTFLGVAQTFNIANAPVAQIGDGTGNQRMNNVISTGSGQLFVVDGGVTQAATATANTIAANTTFNLANAWTANDFSTVLKGGTPATDAAGTIPVVNILQVGANNAAAFLFGPISSIGYFPTRRTNNELLYMTTWGVAFDLPPLQQGGGGVIGGIPAAFHAKGPTAEDKRRSRIKFGLEKEAEKVIEQVARSQVIRKETDQQKRFEELSRELMLQGIEFDSRYLTALNQERERLIAAAREESRIRAQSERDLQMIMKLAAQALDQHNAQIAEQVKMLQAKFAEMNAAQIAMIQKFAEEYFAQTDKILNRQALPNPANSKIQQSTDALNGSTQQLTSIAK